MKPIPVRLTLWSESQEEYVSEPISYYISEDEFLQRIEKDPSLIGKAYGLSQDLVEKAWNLNKKILYFLSPELITVEYCLDRIQKVKDLQNSIETKRYVLTQSNRVLFSIMDKIPLSLWPQLKEKLGREIYKYVPNNLVFEIVQDDFMTDEDMLNVLWNTESRPLFGFVPSKFRTMEFYEKVSEKCPGVICYIPEKLWTKTLILKAISAHVRLNIPTRFMDADVVRALAEHCPINAIPYEMVTPEVTKIWSRRFPLREIPWQFLTEDTEDIIKYALYNKQEEADRKSSLKESKKPGVLLEAVEEPAGELMAVSKRIVGISPKMYDQEYQLSLIKISPGFGLQFLVDSHIRMKKEVWEKAFEIDIQALRHIPEEYQTPEMINKLIMESSEEELQYRENWVVASKISSMAASLLLHTRNSLLLEVVEDILKYGPLYERKIPEGQVLIFNYRQEQDEVSSS